MISEKLLSILCCPETHQPVTMAPADLIADINQKVGAGKALSRNGKPVTAPLQAGLIRQDGKALYPIRNDLPDMVIDRSIPLPV
jgi:uncharacterized protein YbaR (Trm112 family)